MNGTGPVRRVCHLRATNFHGGPEKQILEHARHLDPQRWQPVVAVFREGRERVDLAERAADAGIETVFVETSHPFSLGAVRQLRRAIAERSIDLLVTHGYKADVVGHLAVRSSRTPWACCARGFTWEDARVRLYERIDRFVLRRAPRVVAVSRATAAQLAAYGVDGERIETIHNAIRVEPDLSPVDLRGELGLPGDAELLVAVGRLSPEKGHRVLVRAMQRLAGARPGLHAAFIGDGREEAALRRQVTEAGLDGRVHFPGFRRDVLRCLAGSDVLVNPSFTEGMPNVVLEAFAAGCPVVATDVGGVAELVEQGVSGLLVPPDDPAAMAHAVERLLTEREWTAGLRAAAVRRVREAFSFEGQARRWMALYDRMCEERATGSRGVEGARPGRVDSEAR